MIRLVIGGRGQGKTRFLCETFSLSPAQVGEEPREGGACVHLERLIAREGAAAVLARAKAVHDCVFCADEIGCGILPAERKERELRDEVGRVLCAIARRADEVYRVFAGIGVRIK